VAHHNRKALAHLCDVQFYSVGTNVVVLDLAHGGNLDSNIAADVRRRCWGNHAAISESIPERIEGERLSVDSSSTADLCCQFQSTLKLSSPRQFEISVDRRT
jgi:hypothetical protein